jgi:DNA-binding NarL/FixJ family response regulator
MIWAANSVYIQLTPQPMPHCRVTFVQDSCAPDTALQQSLHQSQEIEVLESAPYSSEGLQNLQKYRPDVVILDLDQPEIDGVQMVRKIKAMETCDLKVLVLSERHDMKSVLDILAAGASSYCRPNTPLATLAEVIQTTAEGQAWIDPAVAPIVLKQLQQSYGRFCGTGVDIQPDSSPDLLVSPLSERELQVLQLIVAGYDNAAIATQLSIGIGTVKTHVRHILSKLSACDRTQAAVRALRLGLVP